MPIFMALTSFLKKFTRNQIAALFVIVVVVILAGAGAFAATQHVSYGTAIYWAITTATTVGYGDVVPHNAAGRAIAALLMLTAIPLLGGIFAVATAAATSIKVRQLLHLENRIPTQPFVAVYGMSPIVPAVVAELAAGGEQVVVVADIDPDRSGLPGGVHLIAGDPTREEVVRRSQPELARRALVSGTDDGAVLVTCVLLRHLAPDLPLIATVSSGRVATALKDLGVQAAVSAEELVGHTLAKSLEAPHAGPLLLRLLGSESYRLSEMPVPADFVGRPLSELREHYEGLVLGLVQKDDVVVGIGRDPTVTSADQLLVVTGVSSQNGAPLATNVPSRS